MYYFGFFQGLPYDRAKEDLELYKNFHNRLPREKIMNHIESLQKWYTCVNSCDPYLRYGLQGGLYIDKEFVFPLEYSYFMKQYGVGIPPAYEKYLTEEFFAEKNEKVQTEPPEQSRIVLSNYRFKTQIESGLFGVFQGMLLAQNCPELCEEFSQYQKYKNSLSKRQILAHIEELDAGLAPAAGHFYDVFTGESLKPGMYLDGEFRFPLEFLHYYKNYEIGISYAYEKYLKKEFFDGGKHQIFPKRKGADLPEMIVTAYPPEREKPPVRFGFFKGLPYPDSEEDFERYTRFKNKLRKETIIEYLESLDCWYACMESQELFTGEKLACGFFEDGEFEFPLEFLHYYQKYNIGIPHEYEAYIQKELKSI